MKYLGKRVVLWFVYLILSLAIAFPVKSADQKSTLVSDLPRAFYIRSDNPALKILLGVNHQFEGVFSTELSSLQLGLLKAAGVAIEPVQIYTVSTKPNCNNNGVCDPDENPRCPDCKGNGKKPTPTPTERICFPESQWPWGIEKVNGGEGGSGVKVAVLDTGVDQDHLDLKDNLIDCVSKVTRFLPDKKTCDDAAGHGTHVAGIILANGGVDNRGIYGVAPDASLMVIKVCDRRGYCYGDDVAAGIRLAKDRGANIINMSFGGDSPDPLIKEAVNYAVSDGVLVVAAAGNDGPEEASIDYPGGYAEVIAVGAINNQEQVSSWSSRGINDGDDEIENQEVEFGAPGVFIESTYNNGCYAFMSGTSMASSYVAGLAAKLWMDDAVTTRNYLKAISRDILPSGNDPATGFGLPIAP